MEKITINRKRERAEQFGSCVWISNEVHAELDAVCNETGLSKRALTDMLLKRALEAIEIV